MLYIDHFIQIEDIEREAFITKKNILILVIIHQI